MHILFLSDNFPPEVNAPASRTFEHCREWVRRGAQVTVITCAPNFPKGQVFDGYRNALWHIENVEGIRVVRVWSYIASNEGVVKRILDYLSFMVSATIASLFVLKVDVIVGTSPQFFTACAAWAASRLKRRPWVFELRDLWPESIRAVEAMKNSIAIRLLERIELFLYRQADHIVVVTKSFKDTLARRGVDSTKIDIVTNGVDLDNFRPMVKDAALARELGLEGCFVAGYIGTHGMAHGLDTLLDAAEALQCAPNTTDIRFLFLGHGAEKAALVERSRRLNLNNVVFADSVRKSDVARYWSLLDVSVIHLRKAELFGSVIPSKLFECMGMGVPVLHGVTGESAEIVLRTQVGELFEPGNAPQLANALLRLKSEPLRHAHYRAQGPIAAREYNRSNLAQKMLEILKTVGRP